MQPQGEHERRDLLQHRAVNIYDCTLQHWSSQTRCTYDDGGEGADVIEAVLELDVSRFQADMAVATPLFSAVCRSNGSKVDVSSKVLAAEAK